MTTPHAPTVIKQSCLTTSKAKRRREVRCAPAGNAGMELCTDGAFCGEWGACLDVRVGDTDNFLSNVLR